jgi:hypothetical protein
MYLNDFDQNGSIEHLFVREVEGRQIPYVLKHELEKQVPSIKKRYIKYSTYNNQTLSEIFPQEVIARSIVSELNNLESGALMNLGNGKFEWKPFPRMTQRSYIFAIHSEDIDGDGKLDLILGGNLSQAKPEVGKYDASYGEVLLGNGDGTFRYWPNAENGLQLSGDIRAISKIAPGKLLFIKNSAQAEIWKY